MHERDLRRVALESSKTTSRKAKARQQQSARSSAANSPVVSPTHSPGTSRAGSRTVSRVGSEDSSDDDDEDLSSSVASLDINTFNTYENAIPDVWQSELHSVAEQIIERMRNKRNTAEAREEMVLLYTNILRAQYAAEALESQLADLVPAFVKMFKTGSGEMETIYALKALAMTVITTGEPVFDEVNEALKARIRDPSSQKAQAEAIHTLGICAFLGGADYSDTEDIMEYFLNIAESNGSSVDAHNVSPVVAAALEQWGLLATNFSDLENKTSRPLEVFEESLSSTDFHSQVSAAENIALIYEQSYTELEDGEARDSPNVGGRADEHESGDFARRMWKHRYSVYHDNSSEYALKSTLTDISRSTSRHVAKDKRKHLHQVAKDVLHTVEHPWRGPRYSTAIDDESDLYFGHRLAVKFGGKYNSELVLDRWWKYHRYERMRRFIAGGFAEHYAKNEVVNGAIPQKALMAPTDF